MPMLTQHLLETFPLLKKEHPTLSPKTIEHLFMPPNRFHNSSADYYSIINSRPYIPNNNNHKQGEKFHIGHAQVKILMELFSLHCEDSLIVSYDNKNKVSIGKPAINRFNRAKKWFMKNDFPTSEIHDFPVDFHIVPSALLILRKDPTCDLREFDTLGREHVNAPKNWIFDLFQST